MDIKNVLIIGGGEIGQAIKVVLEPAPVSKAVWDKDVERCSIQTPPGELAASSDAVFLCVPSWATREAIAGITKNLRKETIVVSLAKGIEEKSLQTMDAVLEETLPKTQPFGILAGPMIAEELAKGMQGIGVFGSKNRDAFEALKLLFEKTNVRLEYSEDMRGAALCGALKNIYAISLGIADGMGWEGNAKGWLASQALSEMADIVPMLGGNRETVFSNACLGDFIATSFSPYSRNREAGENLVRTGVCCLESEGVKAVPSLVSLLGSRIRNFPLLESLKAVMMDQKPSRKVFENLFASHA